jgi:6-phosphogluconolactonase (cycloisomerase 2 family)
VTALSVISCAGSPEHAASPDGNALLYVVAGGNITSYSVDPNSLEATALDQPIALVSTAFLQFDPAPDDHYLYGVWSDAQNIQHLSVFQTDSSGVPQLPAIQELKAASLSQFNMHPSGRFAYMLQVTTTAPGAYEASIRLFAVSSKNGTLKESPYVQGRYGPAPYWPAFLYGFSANGSKLYDMSNLETGTVYRSRSINLATGGLGRDAVLLSVNGESTVAIGKVIIAQYKTAADPNQNYLDVFANVAQPGIPAIRCSAAMLRACATAAYVQLDRSSRFLFLTDPTTQSIHVAHIDLKAGKISATGSDLPITSQTPGIVFSPDGSIVYAMAKDGLVHFYHFDQSSGSLSEGGTPLPIPAGAGICPAQYR